MPLQWITSGLPIRTEVAAPRTWLPVPWVSQANSIMCNRVGAQSEARKRSAKSIGACVPPHRASVHLDDLDAGPIRRAGNIRRGRPLLR
jgi:hypothetical protein